MIAQCITCCCRKSSCCCFKPNDNEYTKKQKIVPVAVFGALGLLSLAFIVFGSIVAHTMMSGVRQVSSNIVTPMDELGLKIDQLSQIFDSTIDTVGHLENSAVEIANATSFLGLYVDQYISGLDSVLLEIKSASQLAGSIIILSSFPSSTSLPNVSSVVESLSKQSNLEISSVDSYLNEMKTISYDANSTIRKYSADFQERASNTKQSAISLFHSNYDSPSNDIRSYMSNYYDKAILPSHIFSIAIFCLLLIPICLVVVGIFRKTWKYYIISSFVGLFFMTLLMAISVPLLTSTFLADDICTIMKSSDADSLVSMSSPDLPRYLSNCRKGFSLLESYGINITIASNFNETEIISPLRNEVLGNINNSKILESKQTLSYYLSFSASTEFSKLPLSSLNINGITNSSTVADIDSFADRDIVTLNRGLSYCTNCGIYNGVIITRTSISTILISQISNSTVLNLVKSANTSSAAFMELNNYNNTLMSIQNILETAMTHTNSLLARAMNASVDINSEIDKRSGQLLSLIDVLAPNIENANGISMCKTLSDNVDMVYAYTCKTISPMLGLFGLAGTCLSIVMLVILLISCCCISPRFQKEHKFEQLGSSAESSYQREQKTMQVQKEKQKFPPPPYPYSVQSTTQPPPYSQSAAQSALKPEIKAIPFAQAAPTPSNPVFSSYDEFF
eukprot:TRINITY_DN25422_c0_g1_i1.p1 TRINITY_DN25422_c0_g1~~TRINITY_DN25422_c0_g1_i1.p1  ORF type:complete len:679 (+),score=119.63 TRINITY_DN25422_c0_g1_i1:105-2141(+)